MPTPGSTELELDRLLRADRVERQGLPPMQVTTLTTKSVEPAKPITPALLDELKRIGLSAYQPGMVLGQVNAHPAAWASLGVAMEKARDLGLVVEDWQMLAILSASLTRLDAILTTPRS